MERIWAATGEWPVAFAVGGGYVSGVLHLPVGAPAPVPAVLMCHGFTGDRQENHRLFITMSRRLAKAGIGSLRIDFRGSGESSGEFSDMTILTEVEDALAALDLLRSESRVDPGRLGILGLSMGGCVAAMTAGQAPDLKAAALWAAVAHPYEQFMGVARQTSVEPAPLVDWAGWPIGAGFARALPECRPLEDICRYSRPVLLIHGTDDPTVKPSASADYSAALKAASIPHKHVTVDGAGHTFNSLPWTEQVVTETLAWFQSHLA